MFLFPPYPAIRKFEQKKEKKEILASLHTVHSYELYYSIQKNGKETNKQTNPAYQNAC